MNRLRANVVERERAMLRAEVVRCRAVADLSVLMCTLIDQGDTAARESSGEPVQPIEAVTRDPMVFGQPEWAKRRTLVLQKMLPDAGCFQAVGPKQARTDSWCCPHRTKRSGAFDSACFVSSRKVQGVDQVARVEVPRAARRLVLVSGAPRGSTG